MEDFDEMSEKFTETLFNIAREGIPTKKVTVRNKDRPWFTNELRRESKKSDRFRRVTKIETTTVV